MVVVRVAETYDLSTQVDKVGMLGIHTPDGELLRELWQGFFDNYRYVRIVGCDVTLACASVLPADPLQIGNEAGEIAPQDMFNPILYKAVSNDSFDRLLNRMYALNDVSALGSVAEGVVTSATGLDQYDLYYGLLADPDGWKKSMPQQGLSMRSLYPIVHQVLSNYGQFTRPQDAMGLDEMVNAVPTVGSTGAVSTYNTGLVMKGPSLRMPRIPTKVIDVELGTELDNDFVKTYVACIITPPAKSTKMYYRMRVVWSYEFIEPRPRGQGAGWKEYTDWGERSYASDYVEQSKVMTEKSGMVDGNGIAIEKVMTAGK